MVPEASHHTDLLCTTSNLASFYVSNTLNYTDANELLQLQQTLLMHEKNTDSTEYSLYRYTALNMKRAHTQAGRLAYTRGNYHTAQKHIASVTMKDAAHQSPTLDAVK